VFTQAVLTNDWVVVAVVYVCTSLDVMTHSPFSLLLAFSALWPTKSGFD